jgi:cell filamentation protein
MELHVLDPFGDYETAGYLRNHFGEKDLRIVGHLESAAFQDEAHQTIRYLRRLPALDYEHITETHRRIFSSLYPWAGHDRSENAPHIAIVKAGYKTLFAHPNDVRRAAEYALKKAQETAYFRDHPGEVFGYLAHAHPFLEGNGRTILTVYADLSRRAGFHVEWEAMDKTVFLETLTQELLNPGKSIMDELVLRHKRPGVLSIRKTVARLASSFDRTSGATNPPRA